MFDNDKYVGLLLDNRYKLLEITGAGGMSLVYRALDQKLNRLDAVKILKDDLISDVESRDRFLAESRAIAMLSHPNIVSIYDVGHCSNFDTELEYIIMELIDGITLKQYMQKRGTLTWKETLHFSSQVAKALAHAHEKGIIHRDIKPQNLMLIKDGTIKVADFGIAELTNNLSGSSDEALGSVHYMAPEQAKGAVADSRSDIYSLGVVMYEMLTGSLPYTGDSAEQIAIKHIHGNPIMPTSINKDIPKDLERIVLKAMNSELQERYQSADELVEDLENFRKFMAANEAEAKTSQNKTELIENNTNENIENNKQISHKEKENKARSKSNRKNTELTKEKYKHRKKQSRKVTILSGVFLVLILIVAISAFLWQFWLRDLFTIGDKVTVADFTGRMYEDVINDKEYSDLYTFTVKIQIDTDHQYGYILAQSPEANKEMTSTKDGIEVELTISSGFTQVTIPDVSSKSNKTFSKSEAQKILEDSGFKVDFETSPSDSVDEGYVISTSPSAGENLDIGSTVTVIISSGAKQDSISVPDVTGMSLSDAQSELENNNLIVSKTITYYDDGNATNGTVTSQVPAAGELVPFGTSVYLTVEK